MELGGGEVLWPASVESMVEHIENDNPAIVHIAGHNQYIEGNRRLVGFDAGGDDDGLSEVESAAKLAEFIVGAATDQEEECALTCVILNACHSSEQAQVLVQRAEASTSYKRKLQVVSWPGLTDDRICARFAQGFYQRLAKVRRFDTDEWVKDCFSNGNRRVMLNKIELTPELIRGEVTAEATAATLPELLSLDTLADTEEKGEEDEEAGAGTGAGAGPQVGVGVGVGVGAGVGVEAEAGAGAGAEKEGRYVMVHATESGREHFVRLQTSLEHTAIFTSGAGPVKLIDELSWRIRFGDESLGSLADNKEALERFLADLRLNCGADATITMRWPTTGVAGGSRDGEGRRGHRRRRPAMVGQAQSWC